MKGPGTAARAMRASARSDRFGTESSINLRERTFVVQTFRYRPTLVPKNCAFQYLSNIKVQEEYFSQDHMSFLVVVVVVVILLLLLLPDPNTRMNPRTERGIVVGPDAQMRLERRVVQSLGVCGRQLY